MSKKTKSDHALILFKAGVSAVPMVGGSIASLLGDYIPLSTDRSIERTIQLLKDRLKKLEDRIDVEAVDKDDAAELFKTCYMAVVRTHRESKLKAAVAIFTNVFLREGDKEKLSYTELDHFARCVEALSSGAIEALGHICRMSVEHFEKKGKKENLRVHFPEVRCHMEETDPALLMGLLGELNVWNLIHLMGAPSVRVKDYGNYPIEITPLGYRFGTRFLQDLDSD